MRRAVIGAPFAQKHVELLWKSKNTIVAARDFMWFGALRFFQSILSPQKS